MCGKGEESGLNMKKGTGLVKESIGGGLEVYRAEGEDISAERVLTI